MSRIFAWIFLVGTFSTICFADDSVPTGNPIIMTAEQVADAKAKGFTVRTATNQTPDQIAENNFADQNMVVHADGSRWVQPQATGQRMVVSSRMAVNEQGQLEHIPTNGQLADHDASIAETKRQAHQFLEGVHTWQKENPNGGKISQESIDKTMEGFAKTAEDGQKRIDQWVKDKSGETPKYEPPKASVSNEKTSVVQAREEDLGQKKSVLVSYEKAKDQK